MKILKHFMLSLLLLSASPLAPSAFSSIVLIVGGGYSISSSGTYSVKSIATGLGLSAAGAGLLLSDLDAAFFGKWFRSQTLQEVATVTVFVLDGEEVELSHFENFIEGIIPGVTLEDRTILAQRLVHQANLAPRGVSVLELEAQMVLPLLEKYQDALGPDSLRKAKEILCDTTKGPYVETDF
jgi:hypothetical protein